MSKRNLIIGAAVVAVLAYGGLTATIIPEGTEAQLTGEKVFDPTANAQSFWQEQGPSYFEQNAVDLAQLFNEAGGLQIWPLFHG